MTKTAIHVDHIARIEGHGNVHVVIEDGAVKTVEMNVVEPARLFESHGARPHLPRGALHRLAHLRHLLGQPRGDRPQGHRGASSACSVTDRTRALRELLVYGSYLQNHATHLFVFAAPDFLGQNSVFPLADERPGAVRQGAWPEGAGQRAVHDRGRPQRASHHGRGGRLHRRDRRRRSTARLAEQAWTRPPRSPCDGGGSLRTASGCPPIETAGRHAGHGGGRVATRCECSDTARFVRRRHTSSTAHEVDDAGGGVRRGAFGRAASRACARTGTPYFTGGARPRERLVARTWGRHAQRGRREGGAAPA